jgi:putative transposase
MQQNHAGQMVEAAWQSIAAQFPTAELDEHVVMPNHFHGILRIVGAPLVGARNTWASTRPAPTVGDIIGAFKSTTTDEYIRGVRDKAWPGFKGKLWQRNFYEHIIRDETELNKIRDYIRRNPLMWAGDRYNPERTVLVIDEEGRAVPWDES